MFLVYSGVLFCYCCFRLQTKGKRRLSSKCTLLQACIAHNYFQYFNVVFIFLLKVPDYSLIPMGICYLQLFGFMLLLLF